MKRFAFAAVAAAALLAPIPGRAVGAVSDDKCKPECKELPALERELFDQEFLQERFEKYNIKKVIPNIEMTKDDKGKDVPETMIEAMQRDAKAKLDAQNASAAGGGKKGKSGAAAGTTDDCKIVLYYKDAKGKTKTKPFNDADFRKANPCAIADFLLEHENQHVADCKAGMKINESFEEYAASDVRAYGAGIRMLRHRIRETAHRCNGWESSMDKVRPNPIDKKEQETVPTPKDVDEIMKALAAKEKK